MTAPDPTAHLDLAQLGDYVDRLLAPAPARAAAEHLAACDACAARLQTLRALLARAAAAPASIDPPRDLWPLVRARIAAGAAAGSREAPHEAGPRSARRWWGGGALAAAAAAAVVIGAAGATLRLRAGAGGPPPAPPVAVAPAAPAAGPDFARVDAEYARAAAQLADAVRAGRGALAPSTVAAVERSLRTIDGAIAEARAALARDPQNGALAEMLLVSHEHKLALLKRAAALPSQL